MTKLVLVHSNFCWIFSKLVSSSNRMRSFTMFTPLINLTIWPHRPYDLCNPFKHDLRCALFSLLSFVKTNSTSQRRIWDHVCKGYIDYFSEWVPFGLKVNVWCWQMRTHPKAMVQFPTENINKWTQNIGDFK